MAAIGAATVAISASRGRAVVLGEELVVIGVVSMVVTGTSAVVEMEMIMGAVLPGGAGDVEASASSTGRLPSWRRRRLHAL